MNWRWNMDYAGGQLMDWVGHHLDIAHWGMDFERTGPVKSRARASSRRPASTTGRCVLGRDAVRGRHADRPGRAAIRRSRAARSGSANTAGCGSTAAASRPSRPTWSNEVIGPNETRLYRSRDHFQNFLDCVRSRALTIAPAEVAHRSASVGHLGVVAIETGRTIRWDPATETISATRGPSACCRGRIARPTSCRPEARCIMKHTRPRPGRRRPIAAMRVLHGALAAADARRRRRPAASLDAILADFSTWDGGIKSEAIWELRDYVRAHRDEAAGRAECEAKLVAFLTGRRRRRARWRRPASCASWPATRPSRRSRRCSADPRWRTTRSTCCSRCPAPPPSRRSCRPCTDGAGVQDGAGGRTRPAARGRGRSRAGAAAPASPALAAAAAIALGRIGGRAVADGARVGQRSRVGG